VGRLGTGEPRKDDGKPLQRDAVEAGHKGTVHDFSLYLVPCEHNAYECEVVRLLQQQWVEVREGGGWRCCYLKTTTVMIVVLLVVLITQSCQ